MFRNKRVISTQALEIDLDALAMRLTGRPLHELEARGSHDDSFSGAAKDLRAAAQLLRSAQAAQRS